jgi:hypothetical protein
MVTPTWPAFFRRWVQYFPHRVRALDIRILRGFIATAKQHVERLARSIVIDAVPRTKINAWLAQAFADRPDIARIAICQPVNARLNLRASRVDGAKAHLLTSLKQFIIGKPLMAVVNS